jgi:HK97 gp10 family phage protein
VSALTFKAEGLDSVVAQLEQLPLKVRLSLEKRVLKLALEFIANVKEAKLGGQMVKRVTGNLSRSIRTKQLVFNERATKAIMAAGDAGARYAADVEFGTKPHEIRAKDAKALRLQAGGNPIFRKKVNHPGTFPRPFMRSTLEEMRPWIELELEAGVREGLKP